MVKIIWSMKENNCKPEKEDHTSEYFEMRRKKKRGKRGRIKDKEEWEVEEEEEATEKQQDGLLIFIWAFHSQLLWPMVLHSQLTQSKLSMSLRYVGTLPLNKYLVYISESLFTGKLGPDPWIIFNKQFSFN